LHDRGGNFGDTEDRYFERSVEGIDKKIMVNRQGHPASSGIFRFEAIFEIYCNRYYRNGNDSGLSRNHKAASERVG